MWTALFVLGRYSLQRAFVYLANGFAESKVCIACEVEEYSAAGFGLQNIDRPTGAAVREELRPIEQQECCA